MPEDNQVVKKWPPVFLSADAECIKSIQEEAGMLTDKKEPLLVSGNVMVTGKMHPINLVQR